MTLPPKKLPFLLRPVKPSSMALNHLSKRPIKRELPTVLTLDGRRNRGEMLMFRQGKPPKLRFQIGSFVRYEGDLYEIIYAYRLKDDPHEWIYCLEDRKDLSPSEMQGGPLHAIVVAMGAGKDTPRVVYELFRSYQDVYQFFSDIPRTGASINVLNKKMIQKATIVSSGPIIKDAPSSRMKKISDE